MNKMDVSLLNLDDDTLREVCMKTDLIGLYRLLQTNKRIKEICGDIIGFRYLALTYAMLEKAGDILRFKIGKLPGTFILETTLRGREPWSITEEEDEDGIPTTLTYEDNVTSKIMPFLDRLRQEQQNRVDGVTKDLPLRYEDEEGSKIHEYFSLSNSQIYWSIKEIVNKLVGIFLNGGEVTILRYGFGVSLVENPSEEIYERARAIEIILHEKS